MNKLVRRVVAVMLLGVVLYGGLVLYRDANLIAARLSTYAWSTFALACALALGNYLLRYLKWEYYLARLDIRGVPKLESLLVYLSGFVLTVTPGKVGEVFKSLILFQLRKVPIERTAPIVIAERVTDLIGVIAIIAIGSASFPGGALWAGLGAATVVVLLVFVSVPAVSGAVMRLLPKLPGPLGRVGGKVAPKINEALHGLRTIVSPAQLVWPTLLSIVAWSLEGVALWVILRGFGEQASMSLAMFFYSTATLAGALVPVPGGLGVTEKLLEEQMARLGGVEAATATAAMILVRFATLWFAVAVGFAALGLLRAKHGAAVLGGEPAPEDPEAQRKLLTERTP
ncbi:MULTISPECIES: lysylphosphatidylglycerol synthase transmembrane domain-containing protein [Polyangium]|uniref:Flippase-like domain-containing protein n=2 Tax=Polyangium TaxID=55 RepID=A0A4U1J8T1_9BACT|nr:MULTISPECIES: lysylphosphatidylglycerol synthase transmembrane domain-containing protein [Polyangium]MDI1430490.1 lysylphosphatidylglycerol synthase transmembrane domain-containing protein [Polyangium sorediatum]TKD04370.1 flippase-like domain-containing protein [Polyangium fumosum]